MNLLGFFSERPSVTNGKAGAGKHISVTARHCRKQIKLSPRISHPLNPFLSVSLNYSFLATLVFRRRLSPPPRSVLFPSFRLAQPILPSRPPLPLAFPPSPIPLLSPLLSTVNLRPRNEKQGHMGWDSKHNCTPDVPAEAAKASLRKPRPLLPLPRTQGQLASAAPPRTTRRLLSGRSRCDETDGGRVMKLLGPCFDSLPRVYSLNVF